MSKIVLITGSNKGIGFVTAKAILESAPEFGTVILTARDPALGLASQSKLPNNEKTVFHQLDVTDPLSISALASFISSTYHQIDVLVNNAGWAAKGDSFNIEIVSTTLGINFYGLKNVTEAFLPLMKPNGHIVNVSSNLGSTEFLENPALAARFLRPDLTIPEIIDLAEEFKNYVADGTWTEKGWPTFGYAVSKVLVNSYTRVLNRELREQGSEVRVNAIHPGWIKTDMAGEEAPVPLEDGAKVTILAVRDESDVTGKYWIDGQIVDFF